MRWHHAGEVGKLCAMFVYAVTIFSGAFLLFQVQPLIGKYILPWFGGGPGVWTTCMLFFQVLLLGGYAYAHFTSRWFKPRAQAIVHLLLLAGALALLPITPNDAWKPIDGSDPTLRILTLLTVSIGLPYFVLSTTGPLVQHWFSRSKPGASPYRLYALSNVGSLLALVSYPFFFETQFTRQTQAGMWAWGLVVYVLCCGFCAVRLWRTGDAAGLAPNNPSPHPSSSSLPSSLDRLLWLLLPACASVLLLATTNKMCQDVAVIPFLWVLPLALYLLSFIICFDSPRWYKRLPYGLALCVALGGICWVLFRPNQALWAFAVVLFICCMVCHGELYRLKPDPRHLTGYYLMIAAGGALGGVFVAAIAPLLFTDYFELQWGLLLCGVLFFIVCLRPTRPSPLAARPSVPSRWRWPARVLMTVGLVALGVALWMQAQQFGRVRAYRTRNFYGVLTLFRHEKSDMRFIELMHGQTGHGLQFLDPVRAAWPTAYFNERSGVGYAMGALPAGGRKIGIIGLGAGTLAAYGRAGDYLRFYEINPDVLRLANSPFTYLPHCKGKVDVVLGDARLSLEREPPQNFDLLVLDAFNSDAIPVHLLTEQAFAVYERHVRTNGLLAFHISNRHLNLEPVVANLARSFNYHSAIIEHQKLRDQWWNQDSTWVLLSRNEELISSPAIREASQRLNVAAGSIPLWTDDFASLFQIIKWGAAPRYEARPADAEAEVAAKLSEKGDFAGAIARYKRALELDPQTAEILNNLAWLLATCPDGALRNGAEAVRLAERACQLTEYQRTIMVGTLAAAYAEAGRFPEAVATAQKACELASIFKEDALLARNQELLERYRTGQPYRDSAAAAR
ncbi:MAG TPA: fused MFS/spermidine synthase [Candidatus Paceibacterota bacterium]|nr:fused MFS/spermidine synthase [Verrucomicrobiota bacterium]HSA08845.1 fused MFS/spermidine synthase [Candidatus Paceibacterota bacterium]